MLRKVAFVVIAAHVSMWLAGETPRTLKERFVAHWQNEAKVRGDPGGGWGDP